MMYAKAAWVFWLFIHADWLNPLAQVAFVKNGQSVAVA